MKTNPILGLLHTILLYLFGRVEFMKEDIGKVLVMKDGRRFTVFRHVIIRTKDANASTPRAVFRIRFQPKNMTIEENKKFSRIPMLVFMGFHGFRSKYWMVDEETGMCQGVYEWNTLQDAEGYSRSIALRFMTKRSVAGSVDYEIIRGDIRSLKVAEGWN